MSASPAPGWTPTHADLAVIRVVWESVSAFFVTAGFVGGVGGLFALATSPVERSWLFAFAALVVWIGAGGLAFLGLRGMRYDWSKEPVRDVR